MEAALSEGERGLGPPPDAEASIQKRKGGLGSPFNPPFDFMGCTRSKPMREQWGAVFKNNSIKLKIREVFNYCLLILLVFSWHLIEVYFRECV